MVAGRDTTSAMVFWQKTVLSATLLLQFGVAKQYLTVPLAWNTGGQAGHYSGKAVSIFTCVSVGMKLRSILVVEGFFF